MGSNTVQSQGDFKESVEEQVTNDALDALNGTDDTEDLLSFDNPVTVTNTPSTAPQANNNELGSLFDGLAMGGITAATTAVAVSPPQYTQPPPQSMQQPAKQESLNPFENTFHQPSITPEQPPSISQQPDQKPPSTSFPSSDKLPTYDQVISSSPMAEESTPPPAPQVNASLPLATITAMPEQSVTTPVTSTSVSAPVTTVQEPPLERLRKARMLLAEGLIEQSEFDEIKVAVLAQLKG
jgi:hypothetical protein